MLVSSGDTRLVFTAYEVLAPDGTTISHESRGGSLVSVQACQVGDAFVEISHLGAGPQGGELVMVVTDSDGSSQVAVGALYVEEVPATVPESWPVAVDLAAGMVTDVSVEGVTREQLEDLHQRLLGVLYG